MRATDPRLIPKLFDPAITQVPTRDGYGEGLVIAGETDPNVVVLCADLTESTRSLAFQQKFPERFVEVGVAEQNMAALAAGFALGGKIPFMSSYATFSPGRNNEQIRTTIAINNLNVKIAGAHAGISVGPDGATHQALEDIALMRVLPRLTVLVPCDAIEARKATVAAAQHVGPTYIRFARAASPLFTTDKTPFAIGRAVVFRPGTDVTVVGCGPVLYEALKAAEELKGKISVEVINSPSVKPLDTKILLASVKKTSAVVTVEEHQVNGGLGGAVAELLGEQCPCPLERIGVHDRFGESGEPAELLEAFGLTAPAIIKAIRNVYARKA